MLLASILLLRLFVFKATPPIKTNVTGIPSAFESPLIASPAQTSPSNIAESRNASFLKTNTDGNIRLDSIVNGALHAWKGYEKFAFGFDELLPTSRSGRQWLGSGLGLTLIDSLDTLYLMSHLNPACLQAYNKARDWVDKSLDVTRGEVNLFETTIRVLGGLLSTYNLTLDKVYLEKSVLLGDRLLSAFNTETGIPYASVDLASARGIAAVGFQDSASSTSEVATIQIEFKYLSYLTGDPKYAAAVDKVMDILKKIEPTTSLVPILISPNTGQYVGDTVRLGSRGDSYYEYLWKQWFHTRMTDHVLLDMWTRAWTGVKNWLIEKSPKQGWIYVGEWNDGPPHAVLNIIASTGSDPGISARKLAFDFDIEKPKMDHLVCFLPGTILLSVTNGIPLKDLKKPLTEIQTEDIWYATSLMHTCYHMYAMNPTHLAPEIVHFHKKTDISPSTDDDMYIKPSDSHSLLRPETVESLFYFWRLTGNETYRDWGWNIWQGIEKYARVEGGGYTSLHDITTENVQTRDKMESFFVGETIKYLYLLFSNENQLPLDQYVFNTEAHAFPVINYQK